MAVVCAGIDWASEAHAVCVLTEDGELLHEGTTSHDEVGLRELCEPLCTLQVDRVAIERLDGVLVERLLASSLCVYALHPNQVKAARARFRVSGGKSDRFDAFVLAELVRTDHHRFRPLASDGDETRALRALTRTREDLVATRVGLANQLRAELEGSWPGAARIFADVDSPIALAFLERYPSPTDARGPGERRLAAFLSGHGYCGRRSAADLLARLKAAPAAVLGELEAKARRGIVLALVATLKVLVERIRLLTSEIAGAVRAHPDGALFLSLFRDRKSTVTAARLVAEIGDRRGRYPSAETLAADAGMCPVATESGKRKVASFRWACDKRLRDAVVTLCDSTRHWHPWARGVYERARARGCDHAHAIRVLGRARLRVLWRMWQDRVPYDPARHGAMRTLACAGG
ncbi:MAG TPA: IS110 family transposase [Thermoleophilia bacterium]|nr:IS110 family transposase [Thermoleophilia bacterium]